MKSYAYAAKLQELATFLLSKPEFEAEGSPFFYSRQWTKEGFVAAVKALGEGTKEFSWTEIIFKPTGGPKGVNIQVYAPRDKVCTLIKDVVWDYEPLLSAAELEEEGK
jgi:hypothetical protein